MCKRSFPFMSGLVSGQVRAPKREASRLGTLLLGALLALGLTLPAYAVKNVKVSSYGKGHQIWFEAEDFDERNPNVPDYCPVVDQAGAFGKALGRTGASGGMMRWTFDIGAAGGKGGTWYFWGRVLNPNNRSDFLLIEGDPQGPAIPTGPSFPSGDGTAPFVTSRDRIFEATVNAWGWARNNHPEGHTKQLQSGKNSMYVFRREGPNSTVFWDVLMWTDDANYVPTDDDYRNAKAPVAGTASAPLPDAGATDVPRDVVLSWTAGDFASKHDVYFGTDPAHLTSVSQGQTGTTYTPSAPLAYGQTYYWRVDEVNAPPSAAVITGNVWSFTTEMLTSQVTAITATASSSQPGSGPENTINGSGLDKADLHGTDGATMWLSGTTAPNWIQYQFDTVYKLYDMKVWNSNEALESVLGFGAKDVKIEYSTDGATWTELPNVPPFARAPGLVGYAANTTVSFGGVMARYVKLTITSNWGGVSSVVSLSEVRFSYLPVQARMPQPATGATGVALDVTLNWRPGREAVTHQVYLGTDANAVANSTAPVGTGAEHSYSPSALLFGTTYYWRVDEVNEAATPKVQKGPVWSFATQEFFVVDDFESYDQDNNRLYDTWIDGAADGNSGSYVGYNPTAAQLAAGAHFAETTIVHSGKQSMPVEYNNVKTPYYSEATRTFDTPQDWAAHGADTLSVWFRGQPVGFLESASGSITMSGAGSDIWNAADQFRFAAKRLSGDGAIVAKVENITHTSADAWAKVGVMIRDSMDPGSRFAAVYATLGNGVRYQARLLNAGTATSDTSVATPEQIALKTPVWVKVERVGTTCNGYYSADGVKWTAMSWNPQTISMGNPAYIGLAVTGHGTGTTVGVISNISTTGNVTGTWDVEALGVAQPTNGAAPLYVTVQDNAGKSKTVVYPDSAATNLITWQQWRIALSEVSAAGVKLSSVKKLILGLGDRASPKAGGAGLIFIDDIGVGHPAATKP